MMELLMTLSLMALSFCVATVFVALIAGIGLKLIRAVTSLAH